MKYDITDDDLKIIEYDMQHNRVMKHLKDASFYKFNIGDVLIREDRYRTYKSVDEFEWKIDKSSLNLPHKYVYVFENELGIGYIRRLSVNGIKFIDKVTCVLEFDPNMTRFSLDPEYADHILLSAENSDFDTKSRYNELKKQRERINRKNKKNKLTFIDEKAMEDWMDTLKIGDCFWYSSSISNIPKDAFYVTKTKQKLAWGKPFISVSEKPSVGGYAPYERTISTTQYQYINIFLNRPIFHDEMIT